jgi:multidrug efflux pump subunit AcrB
MRDGRPRLKATVEAVVEIGNPTIVATLTVVAALLPMLFVSGLMGPYMASASAAMLFSFFVAFVVAPWLMLRLAPRSSAPAPDGHRSNSIGKMSFRCSSKMLCLGVGRRRTRTARDQSCLCYRAGFKKVPACAEIPISDSLRI